MVGEQLEGHPVGDEEKVSPWIVAHLFLREMKHKEHDGHEPRVQNPGPGGGRGSIPHPPGGGSVPNEEGEKRKPKQTSFLALSDVVFQ